jgi:uncharacterized protein YebE (UPF0316 family)
MTFDIIGYVLLPLLIFYARILDVSIGTIRIIFVSKGFRFVAPILGFVEILIWIIAINKLMGNASNFIFYVAYAGGFATGTLIGMLIEKKLSIGKVIIRLISQKDPKTLIEEFRKLEYPVTVFDGKGNYGNVKLVFLIIHKKNLKKVINMIDRFNPKAFYSIEDISFAREYKKHPNKSSRGFFSMQK